MRRKISVMAALMLVLIMCPAQAFAYLVHDPVAITCGASSVSLAAGESKTVSVSVSMWSEKQLPGCGMAECPQTCGDDCLDANGWCTCAGTDYTTEYTKLTCASSNSTVARASISGSTLTITGYSAGSATITITSSLTKHTSGTYSLTVNVADAAAASGTSGVSGAASSGISGSAAATSAQAGSSVAVVEAVGADNSQANTNAEATDAEGADIDTTDTSNSEDATAQAEDTNKDTSDGEGESALDATTVDTSAKSATPVIIGVVCAFAVLGACIAAYVIVMRKKKQA